MAISGGTRAAPILDLIGAKIKFYDTLPAPVVGKVSKPTPRLTIGFPGVKSLRPTRARPSWPTMRTKYYAGETAAVTRTLDAGR